MIFMDVCFLLKKLFSIHLDTGEHIVIDCFDSLKHFSGQGFESPHKLHRQLYSRETKQDSSAPGESCKYNREG